MGTTKEFIDNLSRLGDKEMYLLRLSAGSRLDERYDVYRLFTLKLWWPFSHKGSQGRKAAWLIAKLYAFCPLKQATGHTLPIHLGRQLLGAKKDSRKKLLQEFDNLLQLPLEDVETVLQQALTFVAKTSDSLDWTRLFNDLTAWGNPSVQLRWSQEFINHKM